MYDSILLLPPSKSKTSVKKRLISKDAPVVLLSNLRVDRTLFRVADPDPDPDPDPEPS